MENVIKTLKKHGLGESDLPKELVAKIDNYEAKIKKHNMFIDELDNADEVSEEQEEKAEAQSKQLDVLDIQIAKEVDAFAISLKQEKEEKKVEEQKPEVKSEAKPEVKAEPQVEEESGSGGLGWFLLGAVVLVASAGAVNMMKNR